MRLAGGPRRPLGAAEAGPERTVSGWWIGGVVGAASSALIVAPWTPAWWAWCRSAGGALTDHLTLACCGVVGVLALARLRPERAARVGLWLTGLAAVCGMLHLAVALEGERLHVVQYGFVRVLVESALPRWWMVAQRRRFAMACAIGLGAVEELFQWWLPDRAGEWRDVILDGVGGLIGRYASLPWSGRL